MSATATPLARRGVIGLIAALAASPRAVEAQAREALSDALHGPAFDMEGAEGLPPAASTGAQKLTPEQLLMKHMVREANRKRRMRTNAINGCRSMSTAAKRAYIRDARRESEGVDLKFAKLMGWRAENDDVNEWD